MSGIFREQVTKRITRSSKWPAVRKAHLKENPFCANCGKKRFGRMQVHHIKPFKLFPKKELDPDNLLTLCDKRECHLEKGHIGYFKSFNLSVVEDCELWNYKYRNRP